MASLQQLNARQIQEALAAAAQRQVPITLTIERGTTWANVHSRLRSMRDGRLWIERPGAGPADESAACDDGPPAGEPAEICGRLSLGQPVAVSFKLRHHKHLFTSSVAAEDGAQLALRAPSRMQRLQRRAFFRAEVPPNRVVRVSFWLGGTAAEPHGTGPTTPVWSGRVTNLSAGGFQCSTAASVVGDIDPGETVGVRISFGPSSGQTVFADAQFRHAEPAGETAVVGFQFLGLGQSPEGERALQIIAVKVAEFQRFAESRTTAAQEQAS